MNGVSGEPQWGKGEEKGLSCARLATLLLCPLPSTWVSPRDLGARYPHPEKSRHCALVTLVALLLPTHCFTAGQNHQHQLRLDSNNGSLLTSIHHRW